MQSQATQTRVKEYLVPEDILTDKEESILMGLRDNHREDNFWVGALANSKIDRAASGKIEVTSKEIYHHIGRILGKPARTIRYYAEVERCYSREAQVEYDILPFNFFDYARSKDNWREILNYAMEHPSYSLAAIKRKFEPKYEPDSEQQEKADRALTKLQAVHSLTTLTSNVCMEMDELARDTGDERLQAEVDAIIRDLRKFLAGLVDNSPMSV